MIAVVGYGVGNVKSIVNMFHRIGVQATVASDASQIQRADKIVLPGVGAFDTAVRLLDASGMRAALDDVVAEGRPLLGICLGMQLLGVRSEEGELDGLGWLDAETIALDGCGEPLPHMGWNWVTPREGADLFAGETDPRYYFLHSYSVRCGDPVAEVATAGYGTREFVCAIQADNVYGVQFHPEKSHRFGMRLLKRFASIK